MNQGHVLVLLIVLTADLAAQTGNCTTIDASTRPDCPGALKFFARVQTAIRTDDRQTVAALVKYPVPTTLNHKRVNIRSRKELLSHFDQVFDADVRCAVLGATEGDVWGNWQGFTIGDGVIWFDGVIPSQEKPDVTAPDYWTKYPFKIITVNNGDNHHCKRP